MRDTFNENAESHFAKVYLKALQAIIRMDEQLAGNRLNKLAETMKPYVHGEFFPTENVLERAIFIELRNNKIMERGCLYGDYKSDSKTPWIRDPVLLGMIKGHVQHLGSPDDKEALKGFLAKTEAFYGTVSKPASAPQRVFAVMA